MPPEKQDYLLRLLEELGRFISEIGRYREQGSHDAALVGVIQAQERLFSRPAEQFLGRPFEEQIRLLTLGEIPAMAREKCLAYAVLVAEAGRTYLARGQTAIAAGAYQLALQIILHISERFPASDVVCARAEIEVLFDLPPDEVLADRISGLLRQLKAPGYH